MSSTNHTTNYNLPQFVGSDKPAWLGDINPAMSAIDTAINNAATTASQGVTDAATAQTRADNAYTLAGEASTAAGTAQTTANSAVSASNTNAGKIADLEAKFNLNNITNITTLSNTGQWGVDELTLTLSQNSDGSVFKFYGHWAIRNNNNAQINCPLTPVAGLTGTYGVATGLFLRTAPTEAYVVTESGVSYKCANSSSSNVMYGNEFWNSQFAVGTDGQIYICIESSNSIGIYNYQMRKYFFYASLYFNSNWGDTPTPENS